MAKLSRKGLMGVAAALSLVVTLLVWNYLDNYQKGASKGDAVVVKAKVDILPNTLIASDMVEEVRIPSAYLQPNAISDINKVIGVYSKENIKATEQITERLILSDTRAAGFTGLIPPDRRAMSVSINEVTGVTGFIKPGDYVDVIVAMEQGGEPAANMTLQNILVLAANRNIDRGESGSPLKDEAKATTVTLAVTPDEATLLALASLKGTVSLALRPFSPGGGGVVAVTAKNLSDIRGVYASSNAASYSAPTVSISDYSPAQKTDFTPFARTVSVIKGTKQEEVAVQ